jgi:hypothetical protein
MGYDWAFGNYLKHGLIRGGLYTYPKTTKMFFLAFE